MRIQDDITSWFCAAQPTFFPTLLVARSTTTNPGLQNKPQGMLKVLASEETSSHWFNWFPSLAYYHSVYDKPRPKQNMRTNLADPAGLRQESHTAGLVQDIKIITRNHRKKYFAQHHFGFFLDLHSRTLGFPTWNTRPRRIFCQKVLQETNWRRSKAKKPWPRPRVFCWKPLDSNKIFKQVMWMRKFHTSNFCQCHYRALPLCPSYINSWATQIGAKNTHQNDENVTIFCINECHWMQIQMQ